MPLSVLPRASWTRISHLLQRNVCDSRLPISESGYLSVVESRSSLFGSFKRGVQISTRLLRVSFPLKEIPSTFLGVHASQDEFFPFCLLRKAFVSEDLFFRAELSSQQNREAGKGISLEHPPPTGTAPPSAPLPPHGACVPLKPVTVDTASPQVHSVR